MSFEPFNNRRRRAEEENLQRNRDLAALNAITVAVSSSLDLPEVLDRLKDLLAEQFDVPGGIIYFYDLGADSLQIEAAWGVPAAILAECKQFPASKYHYRQVVRDQETYSRPDIRGVKPFSTLGLHSSRPTWQSYLCVPLVAKGEVQGVLDLFSQAPIEFSHEHVTLFTTLGRQVGVAIQNARLYEEVSAGRQRLQILSKQLLEVQEAERRHIAQELHDEIGQALTAVKVNMQAALRTNDLASLSPYLEESIFIVERTLQQVRNLSLDLRPSLLDDLGVVAALRWYIERQSRRAGFQAQFIPNPAEMRLPPEIETTCFRIVQEALTNIVRHAQARNVHVELHQRPSELELTIQDDGIGFDVDSTIGRSVGDMSLGLVGMQERVQLAGGWIKIQSNPSLGTEIRVYFPLDSPEDSISG